MATTKITYPQKFEGDYYTAEEANQVKSVVNNNADEINLKVAKTSKDATDGYVGLTLFKINFKNALNTFTSFFTNANTAARTYTFPDKNGTVAMLDDTIVPNAAITGATKTKITYDSKGLVTGGADATTSDISDSTDKRYVSDAEKIAITHSNRAALDLVSNTNTGDETNATLSTKLNASASKVTLVDADISLGLDSAASFGLIKTTLLNVWTYISGKITSTFVTGKLITNFISGAGTVAATDTILQAINKLDGNIALRVLLTTLSTEQIAGIIKLAGATEAALGIDDLKALTSLKSYLEGRLNYPMYENSYTDINLGAFNFFNNGAMMNANGGLLYKLINKTGVASIKGTVVAVSSTTDLAFMVNPIDSDMPIGVVFEDGIPDGSECWVVWGGKAQILIVNGVAATRGQISYSSSTVAGRVDSSASVPAAATHFRELGHTLESKAAGTNVLVFHELHKN